MLNDPIFAFSLLVKYRLSLPSLPAHICFNEPIIFIRLIRMYNTYTHTYGT